MHLRSTLYIIILLDLDFHIIVTFDIYSVFILRILPRFGQPRFTARIEAVINKRCFDYLISVTQKHGNQRADKSEMGETAVRMSGVEQCVHESRAGCLQQRSFRMDIDKCNANAHPTLFI